jgi:hypothetical protein
MERVLTVAEVTTLFLKSLIGSAKVFLSKPVNGIVICVQAWYNEHQRLALQHTATVVATSTGLLADGLVPNHTQLILDDKYVLVSTLRIVRL